MELFNNLVIFEMANNHMGDVEFGLEIIKQYSKVKEFYKNKNLQFAFKFQLRDIDTYLYKNPINYYLGEENEKYTNIHK